jgi:hypothetical protein
VVRASGSAHQLDKDFVGDAQLPGRKAHNVAAAFQQAQIRERIKSRGQLHAVRMLDFRDVDSIKLAQA